MNLQIFRNSEFGELGVLVEDGKELFPASECAKLLGYINPHKAVIDHCIPDGVTKREVIDSLGRVQEKNFITEGNLYRLVVKSQLEGAVRFERWVFDEVLPSIRKHGAYMTPETLKQSLQDPKFTLVLVQTLQEEQEKNEQLNQQIESDKPFVNFGRSIAHSSDSITLGEFAKLCHNNDIGIGRNRLFDWMRDSGYLISSGRAKNSPLQKYVDQGLFQVKESTIHTVKGDLITTTTLITGKGQMYFLEKLQQRFCKCS